MDNPSQSADIRASSSTISTPMEGAEPVEGGSSHSSTFCPESIAIKASSIGIDDLSNDVCLHVAEELSYKMRELIYTSKFVMDRHKRTTLTTNDVKKAMKLLGGCEIFGQDSKQPGEFVHIPGLPGEMDLFVEKDTVIDVVETSLEEVTYKQRPEPYIQGAWIMPEGNVEEPMSVPANSAYYRAIAKTILTGSPAHIQVALKDLRTNPKIGPLCPYFLNLVALIVKRLALTVKDESRNINLINTLISTVHAIAHNRFVDPSPYYPVNRAVESLLKIVIETNVGSTFDDLAVRFRAGLLLAKVVITWSIELKWQMDVVRSLLQHLLDPKRPLQSHYGAIVALTALGQRTTTYYFWPVIERYLPQLELRAAKDADVMVQHVMAAILVAARSTHQKDPTSFGTASPNKPLETTISIHNLSLHNGLYSGTTVPNLDSFSTVVLLRAQVLLYPNSLSPGSAMLCANPNSLDDSIELPVLVISC
ncbi:hypothetical protein GE061_009353 [Apolygus lucorum]|uniref:Transcription initiation factor TFIID subunit 6 n=1 Tax=Apolygus lucorum TaxID=248454 RepID=A0A8S9XZX4_APOLU|nr:hypothetical protein GE061_009353 [Apolygus lucorum]